MDLEMVPSMVRDAMAMAANSALNRAIIAEVPLEQRKDFEKYYSKVINTQVKHMYQVWNFNRVAQKV